MHVDNRTIVCVDFGHDMKCDIVGLLYIRW